MVGMKPTDMVPSAAVKFFGAGTAACIADLVTFPLDTAKVRLQVRCVHGGSTDFSTECMTLCLSELARSRESPRRWQVRVHWSIEEWWAPSPPWCAQRGPGVCTMDWWRDSRGRWASPLYASASTTPWSSSTPGALRVSLSLVHLRHAVCTDPFTKSNLLRATQVLGLWRGSWRAAPLVLWLWLLHNPQMWWRCVSRLRYDCRMVEGGTTAP